jgi:hypothetical protein
VTDDRPDDSEIREIDDDSAEMRSKQEIMNRLSEVEKDSDLNIEGSDSWAAQLRKRGAERELMVLEWVLGQREVLPPVMTE